MTFCQAATMLLPVMLVAVMITMMTIVLRRQQSIASDIAELRVMVEHKPKVILTHQVTG